MPKSGNKRVKKSKRGMSCLTKAAKTLALIEARKAGAVNELKLAHPEFTNEINQLLQPKG